MHPEIAEINTRYEVLQDYVNPPVEFFRKLILAGGEPLVEYQRLEKLYQPEYEILAERLIEIIEDADPMDVAEAYIYGCRLLQRDLSIFMARNFCDEYYGVMVNAIYAKHFHTSWLFLQALADNVGEEVSSLIEFTLEIDALQETSLAIIRQLKLREFRPQVEKLLNGDLQSLAQAALDVME